MIKEIAMKQEPTWNRKLSSIHQAVAFEAQRSKDEGRTTDGARIGALSDMVSELAADILIEIEAIKSEAIATLRDKFATDVLVAQGIPEHEVLTYGPPEPQVKRLRAKYAYEMADAMIAQRSI